MEFVRTHSLLKRKSVFNQRRPETKQCILMYVKCVCAAVGVGEDEQRNGANARTCEGVAEWSL